MSESIPTQTESRTLIQRIFDATPLTVGVIQIEAVLRALAEDGMIAVNLEDLEAALDATEYIRDTYFWHKHDYDPAVRRLWDAVYQARLDATGISLR